jgi:hypothetical protein
VPGPAAVRVGGASGSSGALKVVRKSGLSGRGATAPIGSKVGNVSMTSSLVPAPISHNRRSFLAWKIERNNVLTLLCRVVYYFRWGGYQVCVLCVRYGIVM